MNQSEYRLSQAEIEEAGLASFDLTNLRSNGGLNFESLRSLFKVQGAEDGFQLEATLGHAQELVGETAHIEFLQTESTRSLDSLKRRLLSQLLQQTQIYANFFPGSFPVADGWGGDIARANLIFDWPKEVIAANGQQRRLSKREQEKLDFLAERVVENLGLWQLYRTAFIRMDSSGKDQILLPQSRERVSKADLAGRIEDSRVAISRHLSAIAWVVEYGLPRKILFIVKPTEKKSRRAGDGQKLMVHANKLSSGDKVWVIPDEMMEQLGILAVNPDNARSLKYVLTFVFMVAAASQLSACSQASGEIPEIDDAELSEEDVARLTQESIQATAGAMDTGDLEETAQAVVATGEAEATEAAVVLKAEVGSDSLLDIGKDFTRQTDQECFAIRFGDRVIIVTLPILVQRNNGEFFATGGAFYAQSEQGAWIKLVKDSDTLTKESEVTGFNLDDANALGVGERFDSIASITADSFTILEESKRVLIRFTVVFDNEDSPVMKLIVFDDNDNPTLIDLSGELQRELLIPDGEIAALGTDWLAGSDNSSLPGVVLSEADFDSLPDDAVVGLNEAGQRVIKDSSGEVLFVETGEVGGNEWERVEAELPPEAPVFIPEGFQISELGLLQNPETGRDVLAMNPEADWERVREEVIGGLWQANMDWYQFTGEGSDAQNYSSKEAFVKAALEGETFRIGIPVRLDGQNIPEDKEIIKKSRDRFVVLKMVDITLDNIQIQILSSNAFIKYTGTGWLGTEQEAYDCASYPGTSSNVILFTTNADRLMISIGSFYPGNQVIASKKRLIGNFNPELYENYPSYFRPDGIGTEADNALSFTLGYALREFDVFSNAHYTFTGVSGEKIKVISIGKTMGYPDDENSYYLHPRLFIFNQ